MFYWLISTHEKCWYEQESVASRMQHQERSRRHVFLKHSFHSTHKSALHGHSALPAGSLRSNDIFTRETLYDSYVWWVFVSSLVYLSCAVFLKVNSCLCFVNFRHWLFRHFDMRRVKDDWWHEDRNESCFQSQTKLNTPVTVHESSLNDHHWVFVFSFYKL